MKQLYIIRGLPGSGKTTLAKRVAYEHYEADMYFLDEQGNYVYDKDKIKDAHEWCQRETKGAMNAGVWRIAVSNTFVKRWEMDVYYKMAAEMDYQVMEITLSGKLYPNVHGVPEEVIERMRNGWEI